MKVIAMPENQWKVSAAITGLASTALAPRQFANRSAVSAASEVVAGALKDAGLQRSQIDGLCVHIGSPRGTDYDVLASMLGLNVRFCGQPWSHGRFTASVITHAAMALSCGMANYVLCVAAYRNSSEGGRHGTKARSTFYEDLRQGGGPHAETPHAGFTAPVAGTAMAYRRYLHKYNISSEKLATLALTQRRNAMRNPRAAMRKPLSAEEYFNSRFIVEPMRLFDCSVEVDGAVAIILTEGHLNGWPQIAEIIRQLRGEAGERQVADARIGQWGTSIGDSLILGKDGVQTARAA